MTILEKLKNEIRMLSPNDYRNAMLMRFGLADGMTHSRKEVCSLYNIDNGTVIQLEHYIISKVFTKEGI